MTTPNKENGIVLLVEDNRKLLNINRRLLEKCGCMVLTAVSLAEARERLDTAAPDAVVLDIMLPDGDGVEFLTELRERWRCAAPVLFLSAKAEIEDVLAGLAAGGIDYITKPYNIDEFRLRVTGMLNFVKSARAAKSLGTLAELLPQKELLVAYLAAEGVSNKDIASRVHLSESRIKTCLSEIYRKLGIAGTRGKRRALAEMVEK